MSVLKKLSQMFSGSDSKGPEAVNTVSEEAKPTADTFTEEPPVQRRVIQAQVIVDQVADAPSDQILIKAEPSRDNEQCKFMVNRPLFEGHSWLFSNFEEAAGSPLAESVFSVDSVQTLLFHDSTAVVTKMGAK